MITGKIPYGRQDVSEDDIAEVVRVLRSDFLTQGPTVPLFEQSVADYCGAKYAVAVNSATSALHIACMALDIGPGDILWTSPITFVASANCAIYCGAEVDFVDIDPHTYNLSVDALTQKLEQAETSGKLPSVVVPVHLSGQSCDMAAIYALGQKYGFRIIEDASHAVGGRYRQEPVGNCRYSDITVFSFHPVKTMTTGEGGILVTDNEAYATKARVLRTHGMVRDYSAFSVFGKQTKENARSLTSEIGPWIYEMQALGYNYRITDIQCALGRSQLKKLPKFIKRRQKIIDQYNKAFADLPWLKTPADGGWRTVNSESLSVPIVYSPSEVTDTMHPVISSHLYTVQIDFKALGKARSQVMVELREKGVGTQVLYIPVYLQPWYQKTYGYALGKCPNAEAYYMKALSLPLHPTMTDADTKMVIELVKDLK